MGMKSEEEEPAIFVSLHPGRSIHSHKIKYFEYFCDDITVNPVIE